MTYKIKGNYKTLDRGYGREVYFTKLSDIEKIIKSLLENKPELLQYTWIDPCSGDGRWSDVIKQINPSIEIYNYDIEPLRSDIIKLDFLSDECLTTFKTNFQNKKLFFIGNPPFSLAGKFINRSLELTDRCYFLCGSNRATGKIYKNVELLHRFENYEGVQKDKRSKLSFETTLNENYLLVWTCGILVNKNFQNKFDLQKDFYKFPNDRNDLFKVGMYYSCVENNTILSIKY